MSYKLSFQLLSLYVFIILVLTCTKIYGEEAYLDLRIEKNSVGEILSRIDNEKVIAVNQDEFFKVLKKHVKHEYFEKIYHDLFQNNTQFIPVERIPFKIDYSIDEMILEWKISGEHILPLEQSLLKEMIPYYSEHSLDPSPFSYVLNYNVEYVGQTQSLGNNGFVGNIEQSMNYKDLVLDHSMNFDENRSVDWVREQTTFTYDFQKQLMRIQGIDVQNKSMGYQQTKDLGGVSFFKDYSLDPYRVSYPTSKYNFLLGKRSLVKTYVNNQLVKSEYLNPGRHTIKDIPLNNGVNTITLEFESELGEKKFLKFQEASSNDLLGRDQDKFDFSLGKIVGINDSRQRVYNNNPHEFYSMFYQRGIRKQLTLGTYLQGIGNFQLLGTQTILASRRGNIIFDQAISRQGEKNGSALKLTYQLLLSGPVWTDSQSLTFRAEKKDRTFQSTENASSYYHLWNFDGNYSFPVTEYFQVSLGGNYSLSDQPEFIDDKWGGDLSLNSKISHDMNISITYSRQKNSNPGISEWETMLYAFLNWNWAEKQSFVTMFFDKETNTKRLSVIRDTGEKINNIKVSASLEDNSNNRQINYDNSYNTDLADWGFQVNGFQNKQTQKNEYRFTPRMKGGFALVKNQSDEDEWAWSLGRPIQGSFVILKPEDDFKNQIFAVKNNGGNVEASNGFWGETLVSNLTPYQYRQINLDPTYLDPGYSLGGESFVLYPKYKSGHLIKVGRSGQITYRGYLYNSKNEEISLVVGEMIHKNNPEEKHLFFTNRNGAFLVEGIPNGIYQINVSGFESIDVDLTQGKGLIEGPHLVMLLPEEAL